MIMCVYVCLCQSLQYATDNKRENLLNVTNCNIVLQINTYKGEKESIDKIFITGV